MSPDAPRATAPLRYRDFRLLFVGRSVSLLGDGAFLVAVAWQAYTLSDAPTALSLLGIAMTVPLISLLLLGGVISDRHDRRRVMLGADAVRAALLVLLAALAAGGVLRLWQMMAIVAVYGAAQAFFDPASDAIVPELLPQSQLGQANALDQFVRPLALRLAGPALGGVLIGAVGPDAVFLADAATFVVSAATLWSMSPRASALSHHADVPLDLAGTRRQLGDGWAYMRRHVWLWGTFASAGIAYLLFMGPTIVLLPYMVKHELGGSGVQLGIVLGAGGLGAVACATAMGRSRMPTRGIAFIYGVWTLATLAVAAYGLATAMLADAGQPRVQLPGDRRHDRVGDDEAAPRPRRPAGAHIEPRLADLDRAAAGVAGADRPGQRRARRARDARRRRAARGSRDPGRSAAAGDARDRSRRAVGRACRRRCCRARRGRLTAPAGLLADPIAARARRERPSLTGRLLAKAVHAVAGDRGGHR